MHKEIKVPLPHGCAVHLTATGLQIRHAAGYERKVLEWAQNLVMVCATAVVDAERDKTIVERIKKEEEAKAEKERLDHINALIDAGKARLSPEVRQQLDAATNNGAAGEGNGNQ